MKENMEGNIFAELDLFNIDNAKTVIFEEDVYAYLRDKHSEMNADLAIKEAGSWETASRLVLTD